MDPMRPSPSPVEPKPRSNRISVDIRWVIVVLLLVIIGMLIGWKPWSPAGHNKAERTIKVTGEATVKAEPDQYVFSPSYQFANSDRAAALDSLTKRNTELTDGLKKLGVTDNQIRTNADDYRSGDVVYPSIAPNEPGSRPAVPNYTLQLTVTVDDKELAQKIQDYLATTAPSGSVTPGSSFSAGKRKELESQARDQATKDARSKAEQSAKNLGFKVGDVKAVSDGNNFNAYPMTMDMKAEVAPSSGSTDNSLPVRPGENELNYSVSVEYYVR